MSYVNVDNEWSSAVFWFCIKMFEPWSSLKDRSLFRSWFWRLRTQEHSSIISLTCGEGLRLSCRGRGHSMVRAVPSQVAHFFSYKTT